MRIGRSATRMAAVVAVVGLALGTALPLQTPVAHAQAGTYTNPVNDTDAADPFVVFDGGQYWAFTTNICVGLFGCSWTNIPVYTSADLSSWTPAGDALPDAAMPAWVDPARAHGNVWAPSLVHRANGSGGYWVLYFAAAASPAYGGSHCLGTATAPTPAGPFTTSPTPLVCDPSGGGVIDPSPVLSPRPGGPDRLSLFYKVDGTSIGAQNQVWSVALDDSGTALGSTSSPRLMMTPSPGWQDGNIEGPSIVADPAGGFVMLYAGSQYYKASYATGYATCAVDSAGVFTGCTDRTPSTPFFQQNPAVLGPGGAETFRDAAGALWLVYHGYKATECSNGICSGARQMRIDPLWFSNGVPQTNAPTFTPQLITS